jgi:predicted Zn finger-like uncharacterized protein
MYTHCPHCDTYFRVSSEQLKGAEGNVRCGRCFGTFNALENLVDEPPPDKNKPAAAEEALDKQPAKPAVEATGKKKKPTEAHLKREHSKALFDELQTEAPLKAKKGHNLIWALASILLAGGLTTQVLLLNVNQFAQQPAYRPVLEKLCSVTGCNVPLIKAPQQIRLVERDIHSHPDLKDILLVKATMVNDAPFTQAFPVVELSLQDITGHTLTGRRFLPKEYLVDPTIDVAKGFASKRTVTLLLELVDPGPQAVGFEFNFR